MATIGTINVTLRANAEKFTRAFQRARRQLRNFQRSIPGLNALTAKMGALFSGAAAVGLSVWVGKTMSAIDATAKLADRIGTTTESLQGLRHAADITGAGAATLDKGLQFMAKTLGEATQGIGEGKQALDLLGISIDDIVGKDPADEFRQIAEAVAGLANQEQKAFVATKLFGRAGISLVNTLALGRRGLEEMQREAERLGITYDRIEAAKVERANDAINRAGKAIQGVITQLTIQLAPAIEYAANEFVKWATTGESMASRVRVGIRAVVGTVATLVDVFRVLQGTAQMVLSVVSRGFLAIAKIIGRVINKVEQLWNAVSLGLIDSNVGGRLMEWADDAYDAAKKFGDAGYEMTRSGLAGESGKKAAEVIYKIEDAAAKAAKEMQKIAVARQKASDIKPGVPTQDEVERARKLSAELERVARARDSMLHGITEEITQRERALRFTEEELRYNEDLGKWGELILAGKQKEADKLLEIMDMERERAKLEKVRAEEARREESIQRQQQESARALERLKQERAEIKRDLERENQLLRAGNEFDRERIRLQQELNDLVSKHAEDEELIAKAKENYAEKLKQIAKEEAEAHKRAADEAKRTADEVERAVKKLPDITKRFAALPGSGGLFGFGAGQVGLAFGGGGSARRRTRRRGGGEDVGKAAEQVAEAVKGMEDPAKPLRAAAEAIRSIVPYFRRVTDAATMLATETKNAVRDVGDASAKATANLKSAVVDLRREVRSIKQRLARAGELGVAGA